ncbi:hypothetical protein [Actinomadura litoris]|uniref:hypothetical protein n=1 Tax=Actinomadura litoris TaxID=2678616 RepID=UPI001FA7F1D6|nr:hypothetical protein [Actinomadura litoris]
MRELMTTLLDVAGLGLVAAGAAAAVWPWLGGAGLAVAGGVVLAGSWAAARLAR